MAAAREGGARGGRRLGAALPARRWARRRAWVVSRRAGPWVFWGILKGGWFLSHGACALLATQVHMADQQVP